MCCHSQRTTILQDGNSQILYNILEMSQVNAVPLPCGMFLCLSIFPDTIEKLKMRGTIGRYLWFSFLRSFSQ